MGQAKRVTRLMLSNALNIVTARLERAPVRIPRLGRIKQYVRLQHRGAGIAVVGYRQRVRAEALPEHGAGEGHRIDPITTGNRSRRIHDLAKLHSTHHCIPIVQNWRYRCIPGSVSISKSSPGIPQRKLHDNIAAGRPLWSFKSISAGVAGLECAHRGYQHGSHDHKGFGPSEKAAAWGHIFYVF